MFCRNCGAELSEGTKFCTKCGAAVQEPPVQPPAPPKSAADTTPPPAPAAQPGPNKTSGSRGPLIGVIGAVVILALAVVSIKTEIIKLQTLILLVVLGMLLWAAVRPLVLSIFLSEKNRRGVPCGLTAAQVADILTRSPWCEGQKLSAETEQIPRTQLNAQFVFEGIRAKVYFYVENGTLFAYSYDMGPASKFSHTFWAHQEAQQLLRYISALERGDVPSAEKIRSGNRKTLGRRIGFSNFTFILYFILVVVLIVVLILKDQGIIKPIDVTSPTKTEEPSDSQPDEQEEAQEPDEPASDEPEEEPPAAAAPAADAPYLGDYEMISEYEDTGASLSLYYTNDGAIYIDGMANYAMRVGEAYGPVEIVDESHFYFEDSGSRLDITYDAASETLTVEETGGFGGLNVTFAGTYARKGSLPEPSYTESNGPTDADIASVLAEVIPSVVAVPGEWSMNEYGTVSITPQSAVPGAFSISGTVDVMMAQAGDGSWFAEASDMQCTVTYNYADEYYADENNQQGFFIDSTVSIGGGYAMIDVTPLDFTRGSDPTGSTYICYLSGYADGGSTGYVLCDVEDTVTIYLDENMEPTAFDYEF